MKLSLIINEIGPRWAKVVKSDVEDWLTDEGAILFHILISGLAYEFANDLKVNKIQDYESLFEGIENILNVGGDYADLVKLSFLDSLIYNKEINQVDWFHLLGEKSAEYISENLGHD